MQRSLRASGAIAALVVLTAAGSALAQPVRLELRIIAQNGTVTSPAGAGVVDVVPTPSVLSFGGPGQPTSQRFELQYRILDLDTTDSFVPSGLTAALIDITVNTTIGGTISRAQLSRKEAQFAGSTPPSSTDTSGLPTGTAVNRAGLHNPFRGGFPNPDDNTHPANGTITPNGIENILPLCLFQSNQGNPAFGSPNTAWFGLYSFEYTTGSVAGDYSITATAEADPETGNSFQWWNQGLPVPVTSGNTQAVSPLLHVIPAPGASALLGVGALVAMRRRRN